jgi:hypothetical protein
MPNTIWDIPTLRHVYIEHVFSAPRNRPPKELQSLYLDVPTMQSKYFKSEYMVALLGQMTQLTTLSLNYYYLPAEMIQLLANMTFLVDVHLDMFGLLDKLPEIQLFPARPTGASLRACLGNGGFKWMEED